jgi:hypothetical protein
LTNCGPIDQTAEIDVLVVNFRPIDQLRQLINWAQQIHGTLPIPTRLNVPSTSVATSIKAQIKIELLSPVFLLPTQSHAEICRRLTPVNVAPVIWLSDSDG